MRLGPKLESIKTVVAFSPKLEMIDFLKVSKSLFFDFDFLSQTVLTLVGVGTPL